MWIMTDKGWVFNAPCFGGPLKKMTRYYYPDGTRIRDDRWWSFPHVETPNIIVVEG